MAAFMSWHSGPVKSSPPAVDNGNHDKAKRRAANKRARRARRRSRG